MMNGIKNEMDDKIKYIVNYLFHRTNFITEDTIFHIEKDKPLNVEQKKMIDMYYDILNSNNLNSNMDITVMNKNNVTFYAVNEYKTIALKIFELYVSVFGNTTSLTKMFEINNKLRYAYDDYLSGYVKENPNLKTYKLLKEREQGADICLKSRKEDSPNYNIYRKIKNVDPKINNISSEKINNWTEIYEKNLVPELKNVCSKIIWGTKEANNNNTCDTNNLSLTDNELMTEYISPNIKQFVFGSYDSNWPEYGKCPKYFTARGILSDKDKNSCHELIEWSFKLNNLYTMCAYLLSDEQYVRFILLDENGFIPKEFRPIELKQIFSPDTNDEKFFIGILRIKFNDDRIRKMHHKTNYLDFFIYGNKANYNTQSFNNFWETSTNYISPKYLSNNILIFDSKRNFIRLGEIFKSITITYREFNTMVCHLNMNVYKNKKYPNILFLSHNKTSNVKILDAFIKINYQCVDVKLSKDVSKKYLIIKENNINNIVHPLYTKNDIYIDDNNNFIITDNIISDEHLKILKYVPFKRKYTKISVFNNLDELLYKGSSDEYNNLYIYIYHDMKEKKNKIIASSDKLYPLTNTILLKLNNIRLRNNQFYPHVYLYMTNNNKNKYISTSQKLNIIGVNILNLKYVQKGGNINEIIKHNDLSGDNDLSWDNENINIINDMTIDNEVDDGLYKIYLEKMSEYYQIIMNNSEKYQYISKLNLHLNDYELVQPEAQLLKGTEQITTTYDRKYTIKDYIDQNQQMRTVLKYRPRTNRFFQMYELLFNHIKVKKIKKTIELTNNPLLYEPLEYLRIKNNISKIDYYMNFYTKYNPTRYAKRTEKQIDDFIEFNNQFFNIKLNKINNDIDESLLTNDGTKYDLVCGSSFIFDIDLRYLFIDKLSLKLYYFELLFALKNLNKDGYFIFTCHNITDKNVANLILITKLYFKKVIIYDSDFHNKFKDNGVIVVCKKFIDTINSSNMNKLINIFNNINIKPSDYDKFKIKYGIIGIDSLSSKIEHVINGKNRIDLILNTSASYTETNITCDNYYKKICSFNNKFFIQRINRVNEVINLANNIIKQQYTDKKIQKIIQNLRNQQFINAMMYAKKYKFETVPFQIGETPFTFDDEFGKMILRDMFSYHVKILFHFKSHTVNEKETISIPHSLTEIAIRLKLTDILIDTRNISEWYNVKKEVRYYRPDNRYLHLTKIVQEKFNTGPISQAWLKMYELIVHLDLIEINASGIYNTFNFCELPGNFISAINHYIKTNTKMSYNFIAQSLMPTMPSNEKTIIGDDYGYLKKYKNKWDFGEDGTGDITKYYNIKYYSKLTNNIELMTSDCGLANDEDETSTSLIYVHFAQLLFILNNLPQNKSFVAKLFLPYHHPVLISMLYTFYEHFDLYIYKGVINPYSKEFYLVGKNYKKCNQQILDKYFDILNNFDISKDIYDNKYPATFIHQVENIMSTLCDNYVKNFDRQLYYVDNYKYISEQHLNLVSDMIKEKNYDWINEMNLKPVNTKDRL
jgi:hypothetical protein